MLHGSFECCAGIHKCEEGLRCFVGEVTDFEAEDWSVEWFDVRSFGRCHG